MNDSQLIEALISIFKGQLEDQKSSAPVARHDRVQDELLGWLSDIEFQEKPDNFALLYFMYGLLKPLERSPSKEFTIQYLQQIVSALEMVQEAVRQSYKGQKVSNDNANTPKLG